MRRLPLLAVAVCAVALAGYRPPLGAQAVGAPPSAPQAAGAASTCFIDLFATDDGGRAVTTLAAQDVRVAIDNQPRRVVSLRAVYRGPGANAAAQFGDYSRAVPAVAERSRTVLLVIDESSVARGGEKPVVTAVSRVLDGLGDSDQAAIVRLPLARSRIVLSSDPAARWADVTTITGRATAEAPLDAESPRAMERPRSGVDEQGRGAPGDVRPPAIPDRQPGQPSDVVAAGLDAADTARATTARAVALLVDGLRGLPGIKSVVVFRAADTLLRAVTPSDIQARRDEASGAIDAAARSRVSVHLVEVGGSGRRRASDSDDLPEIAAATGGTVSTLRQPNDARAFDALRAALSGGYLVEIEERDGDAGGRLHLLSVVSARKGVTIRAARRWARRNDPVPAPEPAPPAPGPDAAGRPRAVYRDNPPAAAAARPGTARPPARPADPALALVLARMSEYLEGYVRDFSNVVAEEEYRQQIIKGPATGPVSRQLRSDLLLLKVQGPVGWLQFRDVFEVDGHPVRDREERVRKLFLERPGEALANAERISTESARYNIGSILRTINIPTLPLALLAPARIGGLSFDRRGEEVVEGVAAMRVDFEEMHRPTLVRQTGSDEDAPASGTLWVDPLTGRILKTRTVVSAGLVEMVATVVYRHGDTIGVWAPSEMEESYRKPGETLYGKASYRNLRTFQVSTDTKIGK